jgi:hypothetical protein
MSFVRPILLIIGTVFSFSNIAIAEKRDEIDLFCVAEKATGFALDSRGRTWESVDFNVSDRKYTFSGDAGGYTFSQIGESTVAWCQSIDQYGFAHCDSGPQDLTINVHSMRYQIVYPVGYVRPPDAIDRRGETPYIEIGSCSNLNR